MNPLDDKKLFFDMQEHPENYSDEQLEAMMAELDKEPDTEEAWQKTLSNSPLKGEDSLPLREGWGGSFFRRIAAVFTAIAFLGIMSLASYRAFFYKTTTDNRPQTTDTTAVKTERFGQHPGRRQQALRATGHLGRQGSGTPATLHHLPYFAHAQRVCGYDEHVRRLPHHARPQYPLR